MSRFYGEGLLQEDYEASEWRKNALSEIIYTN